MGLTDELVDALTASRARVVSLVDAFEEPVLRRQHDPLMSPLLWDLAHVVNYEDLWLVQAMGQPPTRHGVDDLYDAFEQPRADRETLPLLTLAEARAYGESVRARTLELLAKADLAPDADNPLLRNGFVHAMVAQHEHQHAETMLAAIQLLPMEEGHRLEATAPPARVFEPPAEMRVPEGPFEMGTDHPWALDNERPPHTVELPAYWIDAAPVTNAQYQGFLDAGSYEEARWWTDAGWAWRQESATATPRYWRRDGSTWLRLRFGQLEEVPAHQPVQHVCWYEADAYSRWAGRRLPTEAEWEKAARHDPVTGPRRVSPWGGGEPAPARANLAAGHLGPAPVGAYPEGVSALGCHQMVGDVWEWVASDFAPYPGFRAFPYAEYSEVFFGAGHKVLRGGSWATHPSVGRATFRNWDLPIRAQIFAGFRTARDDA